MNTQNELGKLVYKSAPSKAFLYFSFVIMILFSAIGALIYFGGILPVKNDTAHFSGDISVLYGAIAFIMTLAILIMLLANYRTKGAIFYIYEQGIIADHKGRQKTTHFADMRDIYLFSSGRQLYFLNNLAYRSNEHEEWQAIPATYKNSAKVIEYIRTQHQAMQVPKVLQHLSAGKSVTFHYIDQSAVIAKKFIAIDTKSFLKVQSKELILQKDSLMVEDKIIPLSDIQRFSISDWTSQIHLFDRQGKPLFKTFFSSVFSGDTFVFVLNRLVNP